jgi:uncharacterized membrane protein YgaE (UPF0421/DUF939 family)
MNFLKRNIKEEYSIEDESVLMSNEDLSVTYYYDENGNKIEDNLSKVDLKEFETDNTIYFEISDTEEGRIRERHPPARRYDLYTSNSNEDTEEGSVILKPPSKFTWPVLGSMAVFVINILFTGITLYQQQQSFNTKINDRLDAINERLKDLNINTYNKDEMDLKLENLKLGLHKDVSDQSVDKSKDTNP